MDEVAGQLERQALDEKERDDDDEGNSPFICSLVGKDRQRGIPFSEVIFILCVCCVPVCTCTTFMLVP